MYRYLLILICICATSLTTIAQEQTKPQDKKAFIEEMQKKQLEYFTKELNLNEEQSNKLAPVLQQYMLDRFQLFHQSPHKKPNTPMTESEYKDAVNDMLTTKAKEIELQNKYYNNLLKILPAEKVFNYQYVEKKYFRNILQNKKHKPEKDQ